MTLPRSTGPVTSVRGAVGGGHLPLPGQGPAQGETERGQGRQAARVLHGRIEGDAEQVAVLVVADRIRRVQEQHPAGDGVQIERPLTERGVAVGPPQGVQPPEGLVQLRIHPVPGDAVAEGVDQGITVRVLRLGWGRGRRLGRGAGRVDVHGRRTEGTGRRRWTGR